jgi:hypothetical protein
VPQDVDGLIDVAAALGPPQDGTAVYCCGPEPLLRAVEDQCRSWPPGALHVERFSTDPPDTSGDGSFEVLAARTSITATVPPDRTVLDVLADHGIDMPTSCGEGVCGTCETRVLEGEVEHRDALLSDAGLTARRWRWVRWSSAAWRRRSPRSRRWGWWPCSRRATARPAPVGSRRWWSGRGTRRTSCSASCASVRPP